VLHALVLAAEALPIGDGAKDAGAEEAVALRLEGAVIDGLRLGDLAMRPGTDLLRRGELNLDGIEVDDGSEEFEGAGAEHMQSPFNSSALAGAACSLRLRNLFRDDFRRIAMPVILVQVFFFDCGVACLLSQGLKPPYLFSP
jgi:hypothetical protein